jgi:hypothetical protein
MADKKISQLTALSAANLAPSTDVLAIVDTSATETKKIVAQDLVNGVLNVASAVGIGTSSPAYKLDVSGTSRFSSTIGIGTPPGTYGGQVDIYANSNAAFNAVWVRNDSNGSSANAGIVLNASGNSWRIAMGSSANNSNALFFASDAGSPTTRLTLNTNGALVLQGGDTAASGVGVAFPATQSGSSNANTLDDYEEGTWTPTAVCTGQTITYTDRAGYYTKIGNTVRFQAVMIINTVSGAAAGNTTITGLPFANGNPTYSGQFAIGYNDGFANTLYGGWISVTDMLFRNGARGSGNDGGGFVGGYIYISGVYSV